MRKDKMHKIMDNNEVVKAKLGEVIQRLLKLPYNREGYIEQWMEHFKKLNRRKPSKQEIMSFKVGFDAGITLMEGRIGKEIINGKENGTISK